MQSLWMLVASLMFACMGASIKFVLENGASLSSVVLFRALPSVVCILVWAILTKQSLKTQHFSSHFKRNVSGVTSLWLSFYAFGILPLATAASLNYTSSLYIGLYVVFAAHCIKQNIGRLMAVLLGFAGVILVLRPSINENQWMGIVAALLAGLCAAFAMFQVKSLGRLGEPVWRTVFYFSAVGTLTGLLFVRLEDFDGLSLQTWIVLVMTGVFGMFGQLCMTQAYGAGSPIIAAVLQYANLIYSVFLGILFWNNIPDLLAWVGMSMIVLAGVSIVVIDQRNAITAKLEAIIHKKH